MKKSFNKGRSVIEILIVLAVMVILVAIIMPGLSTFRSRQALKNTTEEVVALLNQARTDTISSLYSTTYSVRFESDRAIYFSGVMFAGATPPSTAKIVNYDSLVTLPSGNISLNGGGTDVTFTRLTGEATGYGTITLRLASDSSIQSVITISQTGLVSSN